MISVPKKKVKKSSPFRTAQGRDAVIARREASARSQKAAAKKLAESAAEEEAILRARRQNEPPNHGEEMLKRLAKIRERTGNINFNVAVRERSMQDAKVKKSNAVRMMRSDIKMMEDIRVRQTARLKAIEKARLEELEHEAKVGAIIRMQRIFRHYLPVRLARLKRELEAEKARVAQTGGAPKKVHETLGPKVRLTYAQEKMSLNK